MYNGLYHHCPSAQFTFDYHCCYIRKEENYITCRHCNIKIPNILVLGSEIRENRHIKLKKYSDHFFIGDWVSQEITEKTPFINL